MTSISSALGAQSFSPLSRLQDELTSEVSSGAISASDKDALSAALTDIDSSLRSEAQSGDSQPPSPSDMQSKLNDLIAGEVSNGKLTSAQADELKQVFANTFQGGPGGAGGPPPGGPGGAAGIGGDSDGDGDGSSTSSTNSTNTTDSNVSQLLTDFLKLVQDSQSSSSSYDTSGNSLAAQIQSLIVNYQA